jgi:hypothetical protein
VKQFVEVSSALGSGTIQEIKPPKASLEELRVQIDLAKDLV